MNISFSVVFTKKIINMKLLTTQCVLRFVRMVSRERKNFTNNSYSTIPDTLEM